MVHNQHDIGMGQSVFLNGKLRRRHFLQFAGASALITGVLGCNKPEDPIFDKPLVNTDNTIDFNDAKDIGLINYIYVVQQIEAAFYVKMIAALPASLSDMQIRFLNDIKTHEIIHREFFKQWLGAYAISSLDIDLSSINFNDLTAVFTAAKNLEDISVAAFNGVMAKAKNQYVLTVFCQLASVEARHTAWFSEQLAVNGFADLAKLAPLGADAIAGFDVTLTPAQVLDGIGKFHKTKLNVINL